MAELFSAPHHIIFFPPVQPIDSRVHKSAWRMGWKGCDLSFASADSIFASMQQNAKDFLLKVRIPAGKRSPCWNVSGGENNNCCLFQFFDYDCDGPGRWRLETIWLLPWWQISVNGKASDKCCVIRPTWCLWRSGTREVLVLFSSRLPARNQTLGSEDCWVAGRATIDTSARKKTKRKKIWGWRWKWWNTCPSPWNLYRQPL